ncbi:MAG: energy transducer TonB [Salegentibacter sp.]|uniref:TonB protein C-terminal n=1 Tax=Salegentibacter flavus TaxID=287099 RepID=A0A1I4YYE6_9FLAO|nr:MULTISPECIES: energy transducer TonB [Salegentibacter]MDR9458194.1 energy transducer TonB [Salegentibacter sp.]SFN42977.1 TonB protein C-terminal [Salegentibacter flavus]
MKNLFVIALFFVTGFGFAQETSVEGNTVTSKQTAPVWPGCEDESDKKSCFNMNLMTHVKENYKYPKNDEGEYLRGKVTIKMEVNEEGIVVIKSVEGDNPKVNAAATEMIEKMPKMQPGTLDGKPSAISYTIPLNL